MGMVLCVALFFTILVILENNDAEENGTEDQSVIKSQVRSFAHSSVCNYLICLNCRTWKWKDYQIPLIQRFWKISNF